MPQSKCGCVACDRFRYSGSDLEGTLFPLLMCLGYSEPCGWDLEGRKWTKQSNIIQDFGTRVGHVSAFPR